MGCQTINCFLETTDLYDSETEYESSDDEGSISLGEEDSIHSSEEDPFDSSTEDSDDLLDPNGYFQQYILVAKVLLDSNVSYELKNSLEWIPEYVLQKVYKDLFTEGLLLIDLSESTNPQAIVT